MRVVPATRGERRVELDVREERRVFCRCGGTSGGQGWANRCHHILGQVNKRRLNRQLYQPGLPGKVSLLRLLP